VPGINSVEIEFDEETQNYYICWEAIVISLGKTKREALDDFREAAHYAVDTLIDLKQRDIRQGGNIDG
jgi:predicted RNase H-like HicB family nuclease